MEENPNSAYNPLFSMHNKTTTMRLERGRSRYRIDKAVANPFAEAFSIWLIGICSRTQNE